MLTPSFNLSQTETEVILTVRAPLANIARTELSVVEDVLVFYSSPYYLRLHLPGKVKEVEGETGKYNAERQEFRFVLEKVTSGEHFEDLDLIGKLLLPSKKYILKPNIHVASDEVVPSSDPESDEEELGYIEQNIPPQHHQQNDLPRYGFANKMVIGEELRILEKLAGIPGKPPGNPGEVTYVSQLSVANICWSIINELEERLSECQPEMSKFHLHLVDLITSILHPRSTCLSIDFPKNLGKLAGIPGKAFGIPGEVPGVPYMSQLEFREILDLVSLERTPSAEVSLLREADEQGKFSEEHYLADLMEPGEISALLSWSPDLPQTSHLVGLSGREKELLQSLGNRDYLLDSAEKRAALLCLLDILIAYAYDQRTTFGEGTVESAWNINKLSSTLSWFQSFNTLREVKVAFTRRALTFPLYRHWQLVMTVFDDTSKILKLGRRQILKCLLHIHQLFADSEPRYLLNQLYIDDYCIWIQKISEDKIKRLASAFDEVSINKDDIGLDLDELEAAAMLVMKEEEELNIVNRLKDITIAERGDVDPSSEGESEDTESSSTSDCSDSCSDQSDLDSDDLSSTEE